MAFDLDIPTLTQVVNRARADIDGALGSSFALLRKSVEAVLATVTGGLAFGVYGKMLSIARNIVPGRENDEDVLEQNARLWLGNDDGRLPARAALFTITGTGTPPGAIPANTQFRREDGAIFVTEAEIQFTASPQSIEVVSNATEGQPGFGVDGNTIAGSTLTLVSVVGFLDADWIVDGDPGDPAQGSGTDEETNDALADRITFRAQNPPRGGAPGDYEAWAREVPGVAQAFESVNIIGANIVSVVIVRDDIDSPLPDIGLIAEVQAFLIENNPLAIRVTTFGPSLLPIDLSIALTPNTPEVQASVELSLRDAIARRAVPTGGFRHSHLTEAISLAEGELDHDLLSPTDDIDSVVTFDLAILGDITFSTKV